MLNYPVDLTPDDNGTVMARIAGLPGATHGHTEDEALANAADLLESMLMAYILDREEIPAPEAADGRPTVSPSLLGRLKLALYDAMRARGWRKADLARAMGLNPRQVDRLLDLEHGSTVAQLERALAACGLTVSIETRDLAEAV
ncbi:type II toxin-antitoxin system HicB family antitoxin [Altericroceibacterium xinjiangense]|uniref:type II toxin-antitoxin system HicB family antitoxin n=1 Tax=Altericroceibacterium xinjiangense TaxID=762261 RepID=UPI000F7DD3A6|nr:type II toxin-antitoxin system HicB family antitoxin [Altericroceibacterium xinjiangense]